jgi:hypothetical protein
MEVKHRRTLLAYTSIKAIYNIHHVNGKLCYPLQVGQVKCFVV